MGWFRRKYLPINIFHSIFSTYHILTMTDAKKMKQSEIIHEEKSQPVLRYKKLNQFATDPKREHSHDAGYDLFAGEDKIIPSMTTALVKTGIALQLPDGTYARIADRSSLALKEISICGGVLDNGYRGDVGVIMFNHSTNEYTVNRGARIAQIIIQPYVSPILEEVVELDESERGEKCFGSTGV